MKVKELIEALQGCDPEAPVIVDGYEGGASEISSLSAPVEIALNVNSEWYYGPHEWVERPHAAFDSFTHVMAVHLKRGPR